MKISILVAPLIKRFVDVLNKHVPLKKKQFRANHVLYVSKVI